MNTNKCSNTIKQTCWDLKTLQQKAPHLQPLSFLRDLTSVNSDTLIVDFEPILNWMFSSKICRTQDWRRIALGAQAAVMTTVGGSLENFEKACIELEDPDSESCYQISTRVTFNSAATLGFFQSMIYFRRPSMGGQPLWYTTMIMDIRWLDSPKARKTGTWLFATVGTVQEEYLATAFHENTKLLAYSVTIEYMDRSADTLRWFTSRLCLSYIGVQEWEKDRDERGTFVDSKSYDLSKLAQTLTIYEN